MGELGDIGDQMVIRALSISSIIGNLPDFNCYFLCGLKAGTWETYLVSLPMFKFKLEITEDSRSQCSLLLTPF